MKRETDYAREFANGNINVFFSPDQIAELNTGKVSDIEVLSWNLDEIDCCFIGEQYCLGNYTMGATIYNCHSDLCYTINFSDIETVLMEGKTLKLYARRPDENDREEIEKWLGN